MGIAKKRADELSAKEKALRRMTLIERFFWVSYAWADQPARYPRFALWKSPQYLIHPDRKDGGQWKDIC